MNIQVDTELNNWILNISQENIHETVNKYLKLGYLTATLTNTRLDVSSEIFHPIHDSLEKLSSKHQNKLEQISGKINENLDFVKQSIDNLTQYTNKSVSKGFYGEKWVESLIIQNFPDYTIINNTHNPHCSDFEIENLKRQKLMIEVKNYTRNVPTTEVNKFILDLEASDIQIGIFLSLNTGICNKKRFQIERLESNKKIIYIPNIQNDSSMIIMAILMSESLFDNDLMNERCINESKLMEIYEELQLFYKNYNLIIQTVKDSKNSIEKTLFLMYNAIIENDIKIKTYLKSIQLKMNEELFVINDIYVNTEYSELEQIINEINDKNIKKIYYELYTIIIAKNYIIEVNKLNKYHWKSHNFDIELLKKKVIFNHGGNNLTINNPNIFHVLL